LRQITNVPVTTATPPHTNNLTVGEKTVITIKARFVSVPSQYLQASAMAWAPAGNGGDLLSKEQFEAVQKSMQEDKDTVHLLGEQEVTLFSGHQANVSTIEPVPFNGTNVNIGALLDVVPYYSPDSAMFTLNVAAQMNQLTGTADSPILETMQASNQFNLFPGQTAALKTKIPSGKWLSDDSGAPIESGNLLIFVTPTLGQSTGKPNATRSPGNLTLDTGTAALLDP
jgi:hypothetical protein